MNTFANDPHLVPLKPEGPVVDPCPACGSMDLEVCGTVFPGIHVMADRRCRACGLEHLHDLRVGFAVDHPMAIDKRERRIVHAAPERYWIHAPLLAGWSKPSDGPVRMGRTVHRACDRVIILNTLDFLYGHVLLKLYNAAHYLDRYPDLGLVLIVPKSFEWLVPDGTAEVWSVELGLGRMQGWYPAIDAFVQERLAGFAEVHLGRGYAHPEFVGIDIGRFTGVAPFPLEEFASRPPRITFVLREDRLWYGGRMSKLFHRAVRRLGLGGSLGRWSVAAQDRLVRRTMRAIRKELPGVSFVVAGLGRAGGYEGIAEDLRTMGIDEGVERAWVGAYAASQLVVGVHGSNLLLPTAHAAGCVEVLPDDRFGNIVQDISVRWNDRMQLFLYRFVDEFAPPRTMARHAVSMFREFRTFHLNHRRRGFTGE